MTVLKWILRLGVAFMFIYGMAITYKPLGQPIGEAKDLVGFDAVCAIPGIFGWFVLMAATGIGIYAMFYFIIKWIFSSSNS